VLFRSDGFFLSALDADASWTQRYLHLPHTRPSCKLMWNIFLIKRRWHRSGCFPLVWSAHGRRKN